MNTNTTPTLPDIRNDLRELEESVRTYRNALDERSAKDDHTRRILQGAEDDLFAVRRTLNEAIGWETDRV